MKLRQQEIVIRANPELCFEVVAAAGRRLEKRSETEWVVEFTSTVGGREIRTVELLTLERPRAIHYRWLEGPLPEVKEAILFAGVDGDQTKLTYRGVFSVGWGAGGWIIGLLRVRPLFNRSVKEHLNHAKEIAERRAARTNIHARSEAPEEGGGDGGAI